MMTNNKQIKIGAIISYFSIIINILAGLFYTPWMINQIGKSDYGLFTLANSLISLFMIDFGLSAATGRFVSKYKAEGNQKKINDFLGVIYKLYILLDIFIFVILLINYLLIDNIYTNFSNEEIYKLKIVFLIAGGYSLLNLPFITLNGILTAYEKFIQLKIADLFYRIISVILMIIALSLNYGLYALVTVNAITGIIIIVYKIIVIKKTTPIKINFKYKERKLVKTIFSFSIWLTISSIAQRLIMTITPNILGIVSTSSSIAIFGIVVTIEGYIYTITTAINGMFMPKISKLYADDKKENLLPLMIRVGKFQFLLNMLIVLGFFLVGKEFIIQWMGNSFKEAYICVLLVIIPGVFFNSLQIANTTMIVANLVKKQALVMIITGICNVLLSFYFSNKFGVIGACFSVFIAYMIRVFAFLIITHFNLKINIIIFIKECYLKNIPLFILTFVLSKLLIGKVEIMGWLGIGIKSIIIVVIYICFAYLFIKNEKKIGKSNGNI